MSERELTDLRSWCTRARSERESGNRLREKIVKIGVCCYGRVVTRVWMSRKALGFMVQMVIPPRNPTTQHWCGYALTAPLILRMKQRNSWLPFFRNLNRSKAALPPTLPYGRRRREADCQSRSKQTRPICNTYLVYHFLVSRYSS